MWESAELTSSHPIEKADNPAQPQDTRTIISITEEAEEFRSWIYARIGDKNTAQPATCLESPMNASKARQTKGQSCKFLTLLLRLFPELPLFSCLGHCGHGLIQPHSLFFPWGNCAFPHGCAHISDSSHPWSSVSVDGKTPGGRREAGWERSTFQAPGQPGTSWDEA